MPSGRSQFASANARAAPLERLLQLAPALDETIAAVLVVALQLGAGAVALEADARRAVALVEHEDVRLPLGSVSDSSRAERSRRSSHSR